MIDENNPSKGKSTLSGDSEPTQPVQSRFRATFVKDQQGNPGLVISTEEITFVIHGDDLFNFYAMLKRGLEGEDKKRPSYLG